MPLAIDIALGAGWLLARSLDVADIAAIWLASAALAALLAPGSGLALLPAVTLFSGDQFPMDGIALVFATAVGALVYAARVEASLRPNVVMILSVALGASLAVSLLRTATNFDADVTAEATIRWLALASVLSLLPVALYLGRAGAQRWIIASGIATGCLFLIAILEYIIPGFLADTAAVWMVGHGASVRATGPLASPNQLGTIAAMVAVGVGSIVAGRREPRAARRGGRPGRVSSRRLLRSDDQL